jgi:beta-mannosidase
VRFASECLAFANIPDTVCYPVHHPRSKSGVARDAGTGWGLGAGWDFDDVRDHYLSLLFGCDPLALRRVDHSRYLELSRLASGEVMAEVIGEWRRPTSPCQGALVLWLKDMLPGSGLGVLDSDGRPKVAYSYLRRAMSPVCVWTVDEGTSGVAIHAANDRPTPLGALLRVALYRDFEAPVQEVAEHVQIDAHGALTRTVEGMLGRFIDAAWAFRFGPPAADTIAVTLADERTGAVLSRAVRFPAGYPLERRSAEQLGLRAQALDACAQGVRVRLQSRRVAYAVRIQAPGFEPDDDAFTIEPGGERVLTLRASAARAADDRATPRAADPGGRSATVTAANLAGSISVALPGEPQAPPAPGG